MTKHNRVRFMLKCVVLVPAFVASTSAQSARKAAAPAPMGMTKAQKIADAMSAAPTAIARGATIMDWPADMTNGKPTELRAGTNGWVCYPSMRMPGSPVAESPMCLDKQWQNWAAAYMTKGTPHATAVGVAYMLRGDGGASNTDPFAEAPTADNHWVVSPAHLMLLYPDPKMLDAYPTDPMSGGPWVMWKGTPYAHVMVPVSGTKAATTSK